MRSAFDLPAAQRTAIQNALNDTFSTEVRVRFEIAPDLISGIELSTNGHKLAWSISDYLASLEKGVDDLLKNKDKVEAQVMKSSDLTSQIGKRAYRTLRGARWQNQKQIRLEKGRRNSES